MMARSRREEQSDATRRALIKTARTLFARHGYAGTAIEEISRRTRVTRGALYHHFDGKQDLFRAVCEDMGQEMADALVASTMQEERGHLHLELGCAAFLDLCMRPDYQRIWLLDGPSVLGWEAWYEMDAKYGLGLVQWAIQGAIDGDYFAPQPVEPLAQVILGALNAAGLAIARSADPDATRGEMGEAIAHLLDGLKR